MDLHSLSRSKLGDGDEDLKGQIVAIAEFGTRQRR